MRRLFLALTLAILGSSRAALAKPRVVVLDDGEKIARGADHPLGEGPWPTGAINLFALRGETLALQVVVVAADAPVTDVRALVEPFVATDGARLALSSEAFVERFVVVARPTGNDRGEEGLAFTPKAAPGAMFIGALADPLVPVAYEVARAAPHERAAIWIDLTVSPEARAGVYGAALLVRDAGGELASRRITLRVIDEVLPFAAAPAFVFYGDDELSRRMGDPRDGRPETALRDLLHAHHLGAVRGLNGNALRDPRALDLDRAAVDGELYARTRGYDGPGQGVGEGVLALGTYGSLGKPTAEARDLAEKLARGVVGDRGAGTTAAFVYAIDEQCDSDWPARWVDLLRGSYALRGFRVAATCGADPSTQAADLVLQTPRDLDPARARLAEREGKWVWAYNGMRPWAGPMMLDVPATDLRANAWIAMRYGVPRWFYWESTFWFDDNRGGKGGERGFDPFTVAETFHNRDGDHANGDGILVYPGTQVTTGMVSYGAPALFPSVRLENLRRGIEDAGYIALARRIDRARADAIVARAVPRALAWAGERPSWPQDGKGWLEARRALADVLTSPPTRTSSSADAAGEVVSESCSITMSSVRVMGTARWVALSLWGAIALVVRASFRKNRTRGNEQQT